MAADFDRPSHPTQGRYTDPQIGAVLDNKYTLLDLLGMGAMGQVWKGQELRRGRVVAVKLLPLSARQSREAADAVEEAFRLIEALTHEGICKALALEDDSEYGPFLVMDYIEGVPLSRHAREHRSQGRKIEVADVFLWLGTVARGLDFAHRHPVTLLDGSPAMGVLHRDVKPDNILVVRDGQGAFVRSVLIDYGLAAEIRATVTKVTRAEPDTSGTLPYMAPEQVRGKRGQWDSRTDQYSLAVVAYELLAGHLPFESDDTGSLREAIKNETPDAIGRLSAEVNAVLLRGLAKERDGRFANCVGFLDALAAAASAAPVPPPAPRVVVPQRPPLLSAPFSQAEAQAAQSAWSKYLGIPVEEQDQWGQEFVLVPPGEFTMGSPEGVGDDDEHPARRVRITAAKQIGKFPVTVAQFEAFVIATGYRTEAETSGEGAYGWDGKKWERHPRFNWRSPGFAQQESHPVTCVSHNDCQHLIEWLNRAQTEYVYSLLTEAEWEYAARAGTTTAHYGGDDAAAVHLLGNVDRKRGGTCPVGEYQRNAFGLFDMLGNVWEWCSDWYAKDFYAIGPLNDPTGPSEGADRVIRGASWNYDPSIARGAPRFRFAPDNRNNNLGLRLLRVRR
jgi:sulfatase modifying factor 1